jgi:hypothetical protein
MLEVIISVKFELMFPKREVTSYVRPLSNPKEEEEVSIEVSSRLSSHLHTGVKTPSNSKLIPDWITNLQTPTKIDVTLILLAQGPGFGTRNSPFPRRSEPSTYVAACVPMLSS